MKKFIISSFVVMVNLTLMFCFAVIMYGTYFNGGTIFLNLGSEATFEIILLSVCIPINVIGSTIMLKWVDKREDQQ